MTDLTLFQTYVYNFNSVLAERRHIVTDNKIHPIEFVSVMFSIVTQRPTAFHCS
jgi:hypothetical protein